jgi:hypothetical protein
MGMSDFMENLVRMHLLRTGTWAKPTVLAIALHTADPGDTTVGAAATEVANANAYARVLRNPLDANWTAASLTDGLSDNAAIVTFPTPTGSGWGLISHVSLWDNATYGAGNVWISGPLVIPMTALAGDPIVFPIGALDLIFGL